MGTYRAAEQALLDVCRTVRIDGQLIFGEANSATDDWSVIDSGTSAYGLVIEMGGDTVAGDALDGRGSQGLTQERHEIRVTITRKVGTGASGATAIIRDLKEVVAALTDHIRRHGRLGGVVRRAWPSRISVVFDRYPTTGRREAPTHAAQRITVTVYCESDDIDEEGGA